MNIFYNDKEVEGEMNPEKAIFPMYLYTKLCFPKSFYIGALNHRL